MNLALLFSVEFKREKHLSGSKGRCSHQLWGWQFLCSGPWCLPRAAAHRHQSAPLQHSPGRHTAGQQHLPISRGCSVQGGGWFHTGWGGVGSRHELRNRFRNMNLRECRFLVFFFFLLWNRLFAKPNTPTAFWAIQTQVITCSWKRWQKSQQAKSPRHLNHLRGSSLIRSVCFRPKASGREQENLSLNSKNRFR